MAIKIFIKESVFMELRDDQTDLENEENEENDDREDLSDSGSDSSEKKRANFIRVAEPRIRAALKKIRLVSKLGNRAQYEYDDKQVAQIIESFEREFQNLKDSFKSKDDEEITFSFREY